MNFAVGKVRLTGLLATLSLGAGDKLAVADALAALVALPDRAAEPRGVDQPSAPGSHGN